MSTTAGIRQSGNERGALILSYVIIVPVFMAALLVIVQASLWYLAREAALAAARQGLLQPGAFTRGSTPAIVQITVTGKVPSLVPGLPIAVTQVAQAPVEQFTTP
jgi:hypothetical protein